MPRIEKSGMTGGRYKIGEAQKGVFKELMTEAHGNPQKMAALAAALATPVSLVVAEKELVSTFLAQHEVPVGVDLVYDVTDELEAFFIAIGGDPVRSPLTKNQIRPEIDRCHSNPVIDINDLRYGNIGKMEDRINAAGVAISKALNMRLFSLLSTAVPAANRVTCTGGVITEEAMRQLFGKIEDQGLAVKNIVMRGSVSGGLGTFEGLLSEQAKEELRLKGSLKIYNGANVFTSANMVAMEVIAIADDEVGKNPVRTMMESKDESKGFNFEALVWTEQGMAITKPSRLAKVTISA